LAWRRASAAPDSSPICSHRVCRGSNIRRAQGQEVMRCVLKPEPAICICQHHRRAMPCHSMARRAPAPSAPPHTHLLLQLCQQSVEGLQDGVGGGALLALHDAGKRLRGEQGGEAAVHCHRGFRKLRSGCDAGVHACGAGAGWPAMLRPRGLIPLDVQAISFRSGGRALV
jgi:hypothetical protein